MTKKNSFHHTLIKITFSFLATLFLGGFFQSIVDAASLPAAPGTFYLDQENILNQTTKDLVVNKNLVYKKTTQQPQILLAVVKSTNGQDIDQYAPDLFQKWGIGQEKEDNGILILYAVNGGNRNVRIEVGYGLEGAVTDAKSGNILRANASDLKSSDPAKINKGLQNTFNAVATLVDKEYGFKADKNTLSDKEMNEIEHPNRVDLPWAIIIGFVIFALAGWFGSRNNKNRHDPPSGGSSGDGSIWPWLWLGGSGFGRGSDDDDDHFGGYGGGGFGGGGGFSGGGGSSGGGGASI